MRECVRERERERERERDRQRVGVSQTASAAVSESVGAKPDSGKTPKRLLSKCSLQNH